MELHFKLLVEEVNAILHALGHRPYMEVQALIEKIKGHGETQIAAQAPAAVADDDPVDPVPLSE